MNAVEHLLSIPRDNADREFLVEAWTGRTMTFGEYHESARRAAADLARRGVRPGDRVAMVLHNSAAFAVLYLGCLYARAVAVPLNPALGGKEITVLLDAVQPHTLVVSRGTLPLVAPEVRRGGVLALVDGSEGELEDVEAWNLAELPDVPYEPLAGASPDDVLTIVFTSGTTGRPSGVVHTIAEMVDNARSFNQLLGIGPDNRFYGILAMTYLGGYYNLLVLPYVAAASVVLDRTFAAAAALRFWPTPMKYGVNTMWFVPTIMAILLRMDRGRVGEAWCRENVRLSLVGTAPLPVPLKRRFEDRYGLQLHENYGLSETFFICTSTPERPAVIGSVGTLLPSVELQVLADDGSVAAAGEPGELRVVSPFLFSGRFDLESRAVELIDGAAGLPTGDMGTVTDGVVRITGRKKDLIIRGGVNVSPKQIESVLYKHEAVVECAVVGIPHPLYGEDIAAVVQVDGDFEEVRAELASACRSELADTKQPSRIVAIDSFPKSTSGKIRKVDLREMLVDGRLGGTV